LVFVYSFKNKNMSGKIIKIVSIGLLMVQMSFSFGQDKELLLDKRGTFKFQKEALNGQGPDLYGKVCSSTKAESDAMLVKLENVVQVIRKTPVLAENKGFDGVCRLYGGRCSSKYGYAVPANIKFWFQTWSLRNGKEEKWVNEPPQWIIEVNQLDKFRNNGLGGTDFSDAYNPTNPAFSAAGMHKATVELNELFYLPGVKESLSPGIDRYGDYLVIFNPDRPPYWEQVTVREAFRLLINYWKQVPDKIQAETIGPMLENEFFGFSEAEKDGFAYFGNPESVSRIGSAPNETPVVRPNPAYWNKNLSRSSIQIMVLEIPPKEIVKYKMDVRWERQDGYYYVSRLLYELDVNTLLPTIEKETKK